MTNYCKTCGKPTIGRANYCRGKCWYDAHLAKARARSKPKGPKLPKIHLSKFEKRKRQNARTLACRAIKKGILIRQPCEKCGKTKNIEAHHDDYSKPFEIRWLCHSCHQKHHIRLRTKAFLASTSNGLKY